MYHSFDAELAQALGVAEAILLHHMQYWIAKNEANGVHFYDGRTWTYNSVRAYGRLFPYFSERQLANALKHLEAEGILVTGHYSDNPRNRTLWYAFSDDAAAIMQKCKMQHAKNADCILQNCEMQCAEMSNAIGENVKCTYSTGNNITGNDVTGSDQDIPEEDEEHVNIVPYRAITRESVTALWAKNFGKPPTPAQAEAVVDITRTFKLRDPPILELAIELAATHGVNGPVEYIRAVYRDWSWKGLKTIDDIDYYVSYGEIP